MIIWCKSNENTRTISVKISTNKSFNDKNVSMRCPIHHQAFSWTSQQARSHMFQFIQLQEHKILVRLSSFRYLTSLNKLLVSQLKAKPRAFQTHLHLWTGANWHIQANKYSDSRHNCLTGKVHQKIQGKEELLFCWERTLSSLAHFHINEIIILQLKFATWAYGIWAAKAFKIPVNDHQGKS